MCPWTIVRSWEHLPFSPLPLSPSLFLSLPFFLPWASLDAFVVAGSPSLWCVLGRLCRSWEHLRFLLSFLLFSSSPPPLSSQRSVFTNKLGFCNRFLNEVWAVIGLPPFIWFPFHPPPRTLFYLLSFHVLLSSCLFILILSFSCARYCPDLSLYTYMHAYSTYSKVQMAQVRYNEVWLIGCPFSLGSFSSATTHTSVCLVLFIFICPSCVRMCLPPFRAGWNSHMPPFREACVCNPWNQSKPYGLEQGAGVCFRCLQPTKTHLLHSDIVLRRQNYVPVPLFRKTGRKWYSIHLCVGAFPSVFL